ncbi:response regulator [Thalassotalea ganghwensis]
MAKFTSAVSYKLINYLPLLIVSLLLIFIAVFADYLHNQQTENELKEDLRKELATFRAHIEGTILSHSMLLNGLVAVISTEPDLSYQRFLALSSPLLQQNNSIRNIAYAPALVVKYVNPIKGNENVIGLNYANLPAQLSDILIAKERQKLVFTDLIDLVQGGTGFIARFPVYENSTNNKSAFIGILSSVIDSEGFFKQSKLSELSPDYQLSIVNVLSNKSLYGQAISNNAQPITELINLPYGHWTIKAIPKVGWQNYVTRQSQSDVFGFSINLFRLGLLLFLLAMFIPLLLLTRSIVHKRLEKWHFKAIMDNTSSLIYIKGKSGRYKFINNAFEQILHISNEQIKGKTDEDVFDKSFALERSAIDKKVFETGERIKTREKLPLKDGMHHYLSVKFPVLDRYNQVYNICNVSTDITEQVKQQEHISRTQRLESLGNLTGGIAHDFNNMLGIIVGYSELLQLKLKDQPALLKYANNIHDTSKRGAKLTKKLLNLSREKSTNVEQVNINEVIEKRADLITSTLTSRISLRSNLDSDLWDISVDASDLEDVIINLIINAMHAIDKNGEITITTHNITLSAQQASLFELNQGDYVQLDIADTGHGIPFDIQDKIFDPFFTTKGKDGAGLGLSIIYNFMQRSNGAIHVYSRPAHGAKFSLLFPRCHEEVVKENHTVCQIKQKGEPRETILVVDDEPELLSVTSELLTEKSYRVLSAASAEEALQLLENHPIDLVISDVIMPDVDGYQLAQTIEKRHPNVLIQLMSGYTDHSNRPVSDEKYTKNIILKPLSSQVLLSRLQELFQNKTQSA